MKRCIITVKFDVTDVLPKDWESMDDQAIREYFADTPEIIADADYDPREENIVSKIERIQCDKK